MADLTEPDEDRISKRAGALLDQFRDMVYPTWYDPEKSGTKRKVESPTACIVFLLAINKQLTVAATVS